MGIELYDGMELFGIDELLKQLEKTQKKLPSKVDTLLKAQGDIWKKETKRNTPVLKSKRADRAPGDLKKSWRLLKPKIYKTATGDVTVVRLQSTAPHAHLIEYGHELVTRTRTRGSSGKFQKEQRKLGKVGKYSRSDLKKYGVKSGGKVAGKYMMANAQRKVANSFFREADKMLSELCEDYE